MELHVYAKQDFFINMENVFKFSNQDQYALIIVILMELNVFVMMDFSKFLQEFVELVHLFNIGMEKNVHMIRFA